MSIETLPLARTLREASDTLAAPAAEARRQVEICNACRYCEGYCAVFPAITRARSFSDGDLTQLANLCHNCRGCYYACQYTAPHEFDLNVPAALADLRARSWEALAWPGPLARLFQRSGVALAAALTLAFAVLGYAVAMLPGEGEGFYAYLSHGAMVAIFAPAFLLPLVAVAVALLRYARLVGADGLSWRDVAGALGSSARMDNLSGGQGQGCNYEDGDRFSNMRRVAHQFTLWGFLACFASTSTATLMHYLLDWPAPYPWWAPPKLLGVPGGIALCLGTGVLAWLKTKADPALGAPNRWGGEMGFVLLLFFVSATGLALYWASGTGAVPALLAVHLGAVLTLFVLTPYSKMAHGFFRLAALAIDHRRKRS